MAAPLNTGIRNKILDAATQLLQTESFEDLSLARIARAASISKGTLYYYYSNKDDILFDVANRYLTGMMDELLAWVDNPQKDTSLPRLMKYTLARGTADAFGNLRLYLIGAGVSGHDALRRRYIERYAQFHETLADRIAQRAPGADASYAAWLLLTVMDGVLVQKRLENPAFAEDDFTAHTMQLLTEWCLHPPAVGTGKA